MAILSKSITASSLKAKSSGILSVFYKTIDSLQEVVKSAKEEAEVKQQNIDKLALEKEELMQVAQENEAVENKLRKYDRTEWKYPETESFVNYSLLFVL